jgi:hypothetical protein
MESNPKTAGHYAEKAVRVRDLPEFRYTLAWIKVTRDRLLHASSREQVLREARES